MKRIGLIVHLFIISFALNGQSVIKIESKRGDVTMFPILSIKKQTFEKRNLITVSEDGKESVINLNMINKVFFDNETTTIIKHYKYNNIGGLVYFPVPVADILNIQFETKQTDVMLVKLIDIEGRIIKQEIYNVIVGDNILKLNVTGIPDGYYLCTVSLNDEQFSKQILISNN